MANKPNQTEENKMNIKRLYSKEICEYINFIGKSHLSQDIINAGLALNIPIDKIEERYRGEYASDAIFTKEWTKDNLNLAKIDEWPYCCIDWERASIDLMQDYDEHNAFYFAKY